MDPGTLFLVFFGSTAAFWAGSTWRHHMRTWSDHRVARAGTSKLGKARWTTLQAAALAAVVTYLFFVAAGTAGRKPDNPLPANVTRTAHPCPTHGTKPKGCIPTHR